MFQTHVLFLGHVVSNKDASCDPSKVETVKNRSIPTSVTEIRSFLRLAGYYRKYVPNFSEIASPVTELTKKARNFKWSNDCQKGFGKLKELLISFPILVYPREDSEYVLYTEANANGLARCRFVTNPRWCGKIIAYSSNNLSDLQRK